MKTVNSKIAYAILCMHIDNLEKRYDRCRIEQIGGLRLYHFLTEKQKSMIEDSVFAIEGKLCKGEITPMMLPKDSRRKSAYTYYLRYLKNVVLPEDPEKADKLAYEAYKSMLMNDLVKYKDSLDEYFSVLFANRRKNYECREFKEGHRFTDEALRIYN